ncbi:inhibitor of apoptosis protein-like [Ylistrum balloti]|uniref:inhibitor of apoptosis protein-like n=1 Tax=Ylistrum balloti TaxID=509963 RepID=UPI002905DB17|nr:inhibitor of apoptosis protein-like [Ylistrum balloti]XP_060065408.1 inhibitor of apoptosis protein-like [Ylistrum balloti]
MEHIEGKGQILLDPLDDEISGVQQENEPVFHVETLDPLCLVSRLDLLCSDEEDPGNLQDEGYIGSESLQLSEDAALQTIAHSVKEDDEIRSDSSHSSAEDDSSHSSAEDESFIDLEDCPGLDFTDLCRERCEWPEIIHDSHPYHMENLDSEPESYIDIYPVDHNSGWNVLGFELPLITTETHFHDSTSSLCSLERDGILDIYSLENNSSQSSDRKLPLTEPLQCEAYFANDICMSDSGQNISAVSCGLSSKLMMVMSDLEGVVVQKTEINYKNSVNFNRIFSEDLSSDAYYSDLSSPREDLFFNSLGSLQNKGKTTYDFNEEINTDLNIVSSYIDKPSRERILYDLVNRDNELSEDHRNTWQETDPPDDTVSKVFFSDTSVNNNHILFYIIHKITSQKAIITFHDLEVIQDRPGKTFCTLTSISWTQQRGLWLLSNLKRLGLLTFHEITPEVVIVEPALHGLGGYFQHVEQGQQVSVMESMQYEWMRVRSFWSFPRNAGVSYLQLARVGFFYTGRVSETCCYSCGQVYKEWREGDDPLEIHLRISPECPHLNEREARNRPIYPDINQQWPAIPWEPLQEGAEGPSAEAAAPVTSDTSDTGTEPNTSLESQKSNIAVETSHDRNSLDRHYRHLSSRAEHRESSSEETPQVDMSQVVTRPAVLDSTPHLVTKAPTSVPTNASSSPSGAEEGMSSGQTGGVDPNVSQQGETSSRPNQEESLPRGVPRADPQANYMPRYPQYVVQAHRAETFQNGWPAYLNQTAYEMSSAGFFYAGNDDYCRCFYCGGGLRNWEPGDDPWVEHARWFPRCLYVKQNKGERFVRLVQQRQQNNNAPSRQEPVLQPPPANQQQPPGDRNQQQGPATSQQNQQGQHDGGETNKLASTNQQNQSEQGATATPQNFEDTELSVDVMSLAAVESLKMNGVSINLIMQALEIWKSQRKKAYKMSDVTSKELMQIIFDKEEENKLLTETRQFASFLALRSSDVNQGNTSSSANISGDSSQHDTEMMEVLSLQNEVEEMKQMLMCSVCEENEVTIAFLPCGHLVCCFQCAPAMITCPKCNKLVEGKVKVFLM